MQVSSTDSHAPFAHANFFPEAVKDENAAQTKNVQNENHKREVETPPSGVREDVVDLQASRDAVQGSAETHPEDGKQTDGTVSKLASLLAREEAEDTKNEEAEKAAEKARFFNKAGQVAENRQANSVIDVFG